MKVAFAGTPEFAATILRGLVSSPHEVGLVVSQPDPRKGRGRRRARTPVAELALTLGIPLRQPARISEVSREISGHDVLVVAAYGQILRPDTLYAAPQGAWNVHASLLPEYRGAAPIERAIMAGERTSGVTVIRMDEGLDTGPVALGLPLQIPPEATGGELADLLAHSGAEAMVEVLDRIEAGTVNLVEQDSLRATYAPKITEGDLVIAWDLGAPQIVNLVRALSPRPGARTFHPEVDGPVKIWHARASDGEASSLEPGLSGCRAEGSSWDAGSGGSRCWSCRCPVGSAWRRGTSCAATPWRGPSPGKR